MHFGELGAFGRDHDAEVFAAGVAQADQFGDLIDIDRDFRNQNDVGAAGDAAVERDPSGMAPHDFDDDNAVVRFGGGVDAVDGAGGDVDRGIEAKGEVGAGEIVVDGLGDADHFDAVLMEFGRDGKRVVAANRDQGIAAILFQSVGAALQAVVLFGRIGARSPQDGAASGQDATDAIER